MRVVWNSYLNSVDWKIWQFFFEIGNKYLFSKDLSSKERVLCAHWALQISLTLIDVSSFM